MISIIFYILTIPCLISLYLEATPMKALRDRMSILYPTMEMHPIRYRIIEMLNCALCIGFLFTLTFFIIYIGMPIIESILISSLVSILSELLNRILNTWRI